MSIYTRKCRNTTATQNTGATFYPNVTQYIEGQNTRSAPKKRERVAKMADICLVQYVYWEKTGEVLDCDDCPFSDECDTIWAKEE